MHSLRRFRCFPSKSSSVIRCESLELPCLAMVRMHHNRRVSSAYEDARSERAVSLSVAVHLSVCACLSRCRTDRERRRRLVCSIRNPSARSKGFCSSGGILRRLTGRVDGSASRPKVPGEGAARNGQVRAPNLHELASADWNINIVKTAMDNAAKRAKKAVAQPVA